MKIPSCQECSQAYIFKKQEFKVSQIMEILYKSKNLVIKWSVCCETGEFSPRKGSGRPINPFPGYRRLKLKSPSWCIKQG